MLVASFLLNGLIAVAILFVMFFVFGSFLYLFTAGLEGTEANYDLVIRPRIRRHAKRHGVPEPVVEWLQFVRRPDLKDELELLRQPLQPYGGLKAYGEFFEYKAGDMEAFKFACPVFLEKEFVTAFAKLQAIWENDEYRKLFLQNLEREYSDRTSAKRQRAEILVPIQAAVNAFQAEYSRYQNLCRETLENEVNLLLDQDFDRLHDMAPLSLGTPPLAYEIPAIMTEKRDAEQFQAILNQVAEKR